MNEKKDWKELKEFIQDVCCVNGVQNEKSLVDELFTSASNNEHLDKVLLSSELKRKYLDYKSGIHKERVSF
ncbi:MAG: hypothetical protein LBN20_05810 [Endomicrobium sp.]|jgi:hypothetical protein|nr:hypothetical protein [Endomicrobium sp.]